MIKEVKITNFKSIKELSFNAKKINIFIGKPNTGKSNILESLGVFSILYNPFSSNDSTLKPLVRFENIPDIFYNRETTLKIEVFTNIFGWEGTRVFSNPNEIDIRIRKGNTIICFLRCGKEHNYLTSTTPLLSLSAILDKFERPIKFYRFQTLSTFYRTDFYFLLPPDGENLLFILNTNQEIYNFVNSILKEYNLEIVLDELESKIRILVNASKKFFLPYNNLSDTLQRTIFHFVAILSNKNSVLLFEEPESHSFPYYTKLLAEMVADDRNNNQYFISTHNPYFLYTLIEKAPKEDLAIFVTYLKDYQTKIRELTEKEIEAIREREFDPFFQFDE